MDGPYYPKEDFYKWVGMCIKEWATFEALLYDVCTLVLKANPRHTAIIYYRISNISGRLSLTESLVATIFPPRKSGRRPHPPAIAWNELVKNTRPLLTIRNLLAHSPVGHAFHTEWIEEAEKIEPVNSHWLHVTTSVAEQLTGKHESIDQPSLPDHFEAVKAAAARLDGFVKWLRDRERRARRARLLRRKSRQRSARSRGSRRRQPLLRPGSSRA